MKQKIKDTKYILVTAARNEQDYIGQTIESVINQTLTPVKWFIVNDCSTDNTESILKNYENRISFIQVINIAEIKHRNFSSKVDAINLALEQIKNMEYDYIGILDADITFAADYYQSVTAVFAENSNLGIGGGYIYEKQKGVFKKRKKNVLWSVAGAVQLYRNSCFQQIGRFFHSPLGGEDWYMEINARMNGWEVKSFPQLKAFHHRITGASAKSGFHRCFQGGVQDYVMGSILTFELVKCARRLREKPFIIGAFCRFFGYFISMLSKKPKIATDQMQAYLKNEQKKRLVNIFNVLKF